MDCLQAAFVLAAGAVLGWYLRGVTIAANELQQPGPHDDGPIELRIYPPE